MALSRASSLVIGGMLVAGAALAFGFWGTPLGNFGLTLSSSLVGLLIAVVPYYLGLRRRSSRASLHSLKRRDTAEIGDADRSDLAALLRQMNSLAEVSKQGLAPATARVLWPHWTGGRRVFLQNEDLSEYRAGDWGRAQGAMEADNGLLESSEKQLGVRPIDEVNAQLVRTLFQLAIAASPTVYREVLDFAAVQMKGAGVIEPKARQPNSTDAEHNWSPVSHLPALAANVKQGVNPSL